MMVSGSRSGMKTGSISCVALRSPPAKMAKLSGSTCPVIEIAANSVAGAAATMPYPNQIRYA